MKIRPLWATGAVVVVSGLLAGFVTPDEHSVTTPPLNFESAEELAARLGDADTAGVYYRNDRPVIAVTDADTATAVRDAGGIAEVVKHSAAKERKAGQVYLGTVYKWNYEPEDWALIQYKNPEVVAGGGALCSGSYALGITSGGNYVDEPCGDSDAQVGRRSFYQNVQRIVSREEYEVY